MEAQQEGEGNIAKSTEHLCRWPGLSRDHRRATGFESYLHSTVGGKAIPLPRGNNQTVSLSQNPQPFPALYIGKIQDNLSLFKIIVSYHLYKAIGVHKS